jgi:two-component system, cell cycle sensor histidine kinase and response regulator CckA
MSEQQTDPHFTQSALQLIMGAAPFGIVVLDGDARVIFANPLAERLFGFSAVSMNGSRIGDVISCIHCHPDPQGCGRIQKCPACPFLAAMKIGYADGVEGEVLIERKAGADEIWVRYKANKMAIGGQDAVVMALDDITERKRAETDSRISKNLLSSIFRAAPTGIGVVHQRTIVMVNDRLCEMVGYDQRELVGQSARLLYSCDADFEYVGTEKYHQIAENRTGTVETKWLCKNGRVIDVLLSSTPNNALDITGPVTFTALDITHRKRAEQALKDSEDRFRSIFLANATPLTLTTFSDGRYLDVNAAFTKMTGYTQDEVIGRTVREIGIWANWEDRLRLAKRMESEGRVDNAEVAVRTKAGRLRTALVSAVFLDIAGHRCLIGSFNDITERKQAEQALLESEARFHRAFMASPAPLVISEIATGRFIEVNQQWVRMLGYTREELIGRTSKELGIWADPDERDRLVAKLVNQGRFKDEPIEYRNKFGQSIFALWSAESVLLAGQQVMLSFLSDETERKKSEKEKEKLQKQLLQAHKMETVGRLAGGVAHDYNNMLTVILGCSEMALAKVSATEPLHVELSEIQKAARRSADITRQLLAFARKQTIAPQVLDLNETVETMLKMLRRLIGEDIDLAWMPGNSLWPVKMDPAQVDQILANLCVNARDAIAGIGRIAIETGNAALDEPRFSDHEGFSPGKFVLLSVSDNGCGMDPVTLSNIFEPFFTTKEVGQGTGLGLATVYGIVKQNKGFIDVNSAQGKGSTITIYLPRHEGRTGPKKTVSASAIPMGRGEKVLLVEDEPAIMRLLEKMLSSYGYTVWAVGTPGQAVALAEEHAGGIDLLITDVIMPEMNGRDLSDQLRKHCPRMATLYISGHTANVLVQDGLLKKGMHFIHKPFSLDDLREKVSDILDQARLN